MNNEKLVNPGAFRELMKSSETPSLIIYNLFPRLVGTIDKWYSHVDRAQKMGFNAIFFNPVNQTGFSGSLYSIKNFFEFNRYFHPENSGDWDEFKKLVKYIHNRTPCKIDYKQFEPIPHTDLEQSCQPKRMLVITDLVINHSAIDSELIQEHPEWFKRVKDGKIKNPFAIDPANANNVTIWGDLAEIDNVNGENIGLGDYWKKLIDFYLDLGVDGFRCDAAYQVPNKLWKELIEHAEQKNKDVLFLAETLGGREEQLKEIIKSGFDYIFNSSKWWDYTRPWAIIQENIFGQISPSISFPESHDTERYAQENGGRKEVSIMKYYFSSLFSKGLMLPIGYEYGFKKRIDVVNSLPEHWEEPNFDITNEITRINQLKTLLRITRTDTWLDHLPYPDSNILLLFKQAKHVPEKMLIIMNKNWTERKEVWIKDITQYIPDTYEKYVIEDIAKVSKMEEQQQEIKRLLLPCEIFIIYGIEKE